MNARTVPRGGAGAALMISVLTLLARLAGFGRTLVFTNTVGAASTGDVYLAANTVPNIVFEVVAGGALASLVVPMLAGGIATGDREQVRRTASALLGWSLLILTPLAAVIALAAEPIARLLLGDGNSAQVDLAARFLFVFAPQVVLYGIGIVLAGVLQAHRRFAGPALAPLLSSVLVAAAYLVFAGIGVSTPARASRRTRGAAPTGNRRAGRRPSRSLLTGTSRLRLSTTTPSVVPTPSTSSAGRFRMSMSWLPPMPANTR